MSIQSLDRGMAILKQLAHNKVMTASELALRLGIHHSSASRLLKSLQAAGFVRKPDFHSFALDYGVLLFGGMAMEGFPIIKKAATVCNAINYEHNIGATIAILRDQRLIYFARTEDKASANLTLLDDSDYPIHRSSLGLILSFHAGPEQMRDLIKQSMINYGETDYTLDRICTIVNNSMDKHQFLYLENYAGRPVNAAMTFEFDNTRMALAVFTSKGTTISAEKAKDILTTNIKELTK